MASARRRRPGSTGVGTPLNKGETYTALARGFGIGTTTVFRYVREGVEVLAACAPTQDQALSVARSKAFVVLDGTLLAIDRVGMGSAYDRAFYSGKHKRHSVNVQVIADPVGRLVWASPGARHDMGAAREHGLITGLHIAGVRVIADTAYRAAARRSGSRNAGADSTPTPAATDDSPGCRRRSTQHTPASVVLANERTPNSNPGRSSARSAAAPATRQPSSKP